MPAIAHKLIVDEEGQPREVILSMEVFQNIREVLGADLNEMEESKLREAVEDSKGGNRGAFLPLDDIR